MIRQEGPHSGLGGHLAPLDFAHAPGPLSPAIKLLVTAPAGAQARPTPRTVGAVDLAEARRRFGEARVARLATVRPDGAPHIVPIVFALAGNRLYFVVDEKPKRSARLQRLANLDHEPRASVLVDAYDEDWSRLWWVRIDGRGDVVGKGPEFEAARRALAAKYLRYGDRPPTGPAVTLRIERWRFWSSDQPRGGSDAQHRGLGH